MFELVEIIWLVLSRLLSSLFFIGIIIYLVILSRRISNIEQLLKKEAGEELLAKASVYDKMVAADKGSSSAKTTVTSDQAKAAGKQTIDTKTKRARSLEPRPGSGFVAWLKEDWVMKLGAILILFAVIWFVWFAFANDLIGPYGRIALGLIAGTGVIAFGSWWMRRYINQGGVLLLLGSGIILLTVWAARFIYDFFTPASALGIMFLAVVISAVSSVRYSSYWVTVAVLLLASLIPFLTDSPQPDFVMLFLYLLVVIVGSVWVVVHTGWRSLTLIALIMAALYSVPQWDGMSNPASVDMILLLLSFIYTAVFFTTNTIGIITYKRKHLIADMLTAAGTGIFLMLWILTVVPETWQSLMFAAWMVVFAGGAFAVFRITGKRAPFFIYSAVSIMFLAAGTAIELRDTSHALLTMAYTAEVGAISLAAYFAFKNLHVAERLSLLFVVPVLMSFVSMSSSSWHRGVFHEDFAVLVVLMIALASTGAFFLQKRLDQPDEKRHTAHTLLVISSFYFLTLVWLVSHAALLSDDFATGLSLTIYTIIGLSLYISGRLKEITFARIYGGLLLGFVVLHLIFVEIAHMRLEGKAITFALIGVLLVAAAIFIRTQKGKEETVEVPPRNE